MIESEFQQQSTTLNTLKQTYQLSDKPGSLSKFERQRHDLAAVVDLWWEWVEQRLSAQNADLSTCDWVKQYLLPAHYWHQQSVRTKTPTRKAAYQIAAQHAQAALMRHPITTAMSCEQFTLWQTWATSMVTKFQRTSSPVEGRNGYLNQIHHNRRGLSTRRLRVMTTIHNFHLQRSDGSTAAERLFGKPFPDLFEWLVQQMPVLPQARRGKAAAKARTPFLPTVPA